MLPHILLGLMAISMLAACGVPARGAFTAERRMGGHLYSVAVSNGSRSYGPDHPAPNVMIPHVAGPFIDVTARDGRPMGRGDLEEARKVAVSYCRSFLPRKLDESATGIFSHGTWQFVGMCR